MKANNSSGRMLTAISRKRYLAGYIPLVLWLIFTIVVIGWIVMASLSTTAEIFSNRLLESGAHFDNYIRVLQKNKLGLYFFNSLFCSGIASVGIIFISAPAAYILGRFAFHGKNLTAGSIVTCMSIPSVMLVMPLFKTATTLGLTGSRWVLILLYITLSVPFSVFFLTGFFVGLPTALEEAAAIDGCTDRQTFWKIMFPLAQPGIVTLTIFNFVGLWNEYFLALIFASNKDLRTIATGLQSIVQSMKYSGDWAGLFAGVVVAFLPTAVLYTFLSNKIIAGVTGGAVKE